MHNAGKTAARGNGLSSAAPGIMRALARHTRSFSTLSVGIHLFQDMLATVLPLRECILASLGVSPHLPPLAHAPIVDVMLTG
ncbi:hypothetical protein K8O61_17380 [Xanthomonas cerealis pv. cerealis]|uniref:hypothetical protein n=1 Tax=Xanthomonas cerealis TaxID=3390025 RepID=UPI001F3B78D0|nr:hypothetical protein [Xanthomonas translucens]UKE69189.1 hypothetical protein K8O61_17380 [Xanthomonas translucens pv. pistacia]